MRLLLFSTFHRLATTIVLATLLLSTITIPSNAIELKFTAIPDENEVYLQERANAVSAYLENYLQEHSCKNWDNVTVTYVPVDDYDSAVEALVNATVDFGWYGGLTGVQASLMMSSRSAENSSVSYLAQRAEDQQFTSVFIHKLDDDDDDDDAGDVEANPQQRRQQQQQCKSDSDCRKFSDYCGGCNCPILTLNDPDPTCKNDDIVNCLVDPCQLEPVPVCMNGQCQAPPPEDDQEEADDGAICSSDSECLKFSDYCGGCNCQILALNEPDPKCENDNIANCLVDPCQLEPDPVCVDGQCQAPPPEEEEADDEAMCSSNSDCRKFSDYCGGCNCQILALNDPDPTCEDDNIANCLVDPCQLEPEPVCTNGQCQAPPPEEEEAGDEAMCSSNSDCRKFSDYCGGCNCQILALNDPDPTCEDDNIANCLVDPCQLEPEPVCTDGKCQATTSATVVVEEEDDDETIVLGIEHANNKSFAFGSKESTSGHLMPAYYMKQSNVTPSSTIFTGSHDLTVDVVANGTSEVGALNSVVWYRRVMDNTTYGTTVFYTTPTYADYMWVAGSSIGDKWQNAIMMAGDADAGGVECDHEDITVLLTDSFLAATTDEPLGEALLNSYSTKEYVEVVEDDYAAIEEMGCSLGLIEEQYCGYDVGGNYDDDTTSTTSGASASPWGCSLMPLLFASWFFRL